MRSNCIIPNKQIIISMALDKVQIAGIICIALGSGYLTLLLFGWQAILITIAITFGVVFLLTRRWMKLRQKGLINLLSEKTRTVLLERSILDIFRDLVYFPYITKVISAYLHIAATKPHPQQLQQVFKQLPKEVGEASNRKGLLSLAPSFVEQLVLPIQSRDILPNGYGVVDQKWDNVDRYIQSKQQVHEETMEKRVVHFLDGKLGWPTAFVLLIITAVGAAHMRPYRFKKMLLQNTTFACMLLALIALLIKARKIMRHSQRLAIQDKQD